MNVYRLLGQDPPLALLEPIKKTSPAGLVRDPAAFIEPIIDGRSAIILNGWVAVFYDLNPSGGCLCIPPTVC
jgi:hypothetical protein